MTRASGGLGVHRSHVSQPKEWEIHNSGMAGLLGSRVDWGRPMLDIGGGSSFNVWKDVAVMSLLAIGILIFVPPSSSTLPAFQCPPYTSSFSRILPPDTLRALHQNTTVPTGTIVTLVIIIVASSIFDSSSCAKMVADVDCPDGLHTVVVCQCCL
ncbi:hypothetical protein ARMGADRAFT_1078974 [Armillaria gallica]|uniref:Uncharacterized protein n=1 Tax=Armillaria gallica TaxID=47427 RepID=A0A2H3E3M0_ARMGA|nr:hypothetical protein ARMGADRAFT_1078974 [Armillaria gallica]